MKTTSSDHHVTPNHARRKTCISMRAHQAFARFYALAGNLVKSTLLPAVAISLGMLPALVPDTAAAQSGGHLCQYAQFGNVGQPSEYSVPSAQYNLGEAAHWLEECAYVDGAPWQACKNVNWHLNQADVKLVQVFTNAANDQERCWTCDPGHRNRPETLIGAAAVLAELSREYETRSHRNVTYGNTLGNIERWLQAHPDYCTAATTPPFTSRENIDAATGGLAWHQCGNGHDDDDDGYVDCDDLDCSNAAACRSADSQDDPQPEPHPRHAHCKGYADEAFGLVEENKNRGCGLGGNLWESVSWELHYNWCLSASGDVSGYNDVRRNGLNNCQ